MILIKIKISYKIPYMRYCKKKEWKDRDMRADLFASIL